MKKLLYTGLVFALLTSCKKTENWNTDGETFFLKSEEAVMPVWVTGNVESGIFIITNHGGPGLTSGYDFHKTRSFRDLEEQYALVYWDQRMAGMAKGDPNTGDLTILQHVLDLEKLVTIIQDRYNPQSLFMLGHSWGGGLAVEYLGRNANQNPFNGWIDIDGSIQDKWEMDLKRDWQLPRVQAKYEETGDATWLEIIEWWEQNPYPDEGDNEPYQFAGRLGAYVYDADRAEAMNTFSQNEVRFFSPYQPLFWTDNYGYTNFMAGYDFMPNAQNITIPSLLIWGVEDGAVPFQVADSIYQLLATPEADKYNVQYEECAHSPHWEKPGEFYNEVRDFVERYK